MTAAPWDGSVALGARQRFPVRSSLGVPMALTLSFLAPLVVAWLVPASSSAEGDWWYAVVVMAVAGGWLSYLFGVGEARLTQITFWTFSYVFLGLAPLVQMRSGVYPVTSIGLDTSLNSDAMVVVLAGMVSCSVAVLTHKRTGAETPRPALLSESRVVALAVFALSAATYYVYQVGVGPLVSSRAALGAAGDARWASPTTSAIVVAVCTMPLLVAFLSLLQVGQQRRAMGKQPHRLLITLTLLAALFTVNPISSPRYHVGTVLLAVLAGVGAYATSARVRTMLVTMIVGLVVIFPAADAFRRSKDAEIQLGTLNTLSAGDFDAFTQINYTLAYVHEHGITYGYQALGVVLFWVPRSLWPGKPLDTGVLLARDRSYHFTNLSAPVWSELFVNGGWVLLVLGMFLIGRWMYRFDGETEAMRAAGLRPTVIALILPFYMFILLRGSLLQAMAYLTVLLVTAILVREPRRRLAQQEPVVSDHW